MWVSIFIRTGNWWKSCLPPRSRTPNGLAPIFNRNISSSSSPLAIWRYLSTRIHPWHEMCRSWVWKTIGKYFSAWENWSESFPLNRNTSTKLSVEILILSHIRSSKQTIRAVCSCYSSAYGGKVKTYMLHNEHRLRMRKLCMFDEDVLCSFPAEFFLRHWRSVGRRVQKVLGNNNVMTSHYI